jgi:WD40 repeat protein
MKKVAAFLLIILALTACSQGGSSESPGEVASATPLLPTDTPAPTFTFTPEPTETPIPTPTPTPIVYNQEHLDKFILLHTITEFISSLKHAVWSPDGQQIAMGGSAGLIWVFDLNTGDFIIEIENERRIAVERLAYHPDGGLLAAVDSFANVNIYNLETGTLESSYNPGKNYYSRYIEFVDEGNFLLIRLSSQNTSIPGELLLWDYKTGEIIHRWSNQHDGFPNSFPWKIFWIEEEEKLVVIWQNYNRKDYRPDLFVYSICNIDISTGDFIEERTFTFNSVEYDFLWTPANQLLLVEHEIDGTSVVMDGFSGETIQVLETGGLIDARFYDAYSNISIDGKVLRVSSDTLTFWVIETWLQVGPYPDQIFLGWIKTGITHYEEYFWSPDLSKYFTYDYDSNQIFIWGMP